MEKILDKDQVRAQLELKSEEINLRLDAIQGEVATTGQAIRKAVLANPLVSVGGSVAAGVLVGLLLGGTRKKAGKRDVGTNAGGKSRALIEEYINAIAEEVKRGSRSGAKTEEAVRRALKDRVPVIFYEAPRAGDDQHKQGMLSEAFELVYKTALGFAVKMGIDFVTSRLHLDALADRIEASEGADAAAPVAAVLSDDVK